MLLPFNIFSIVLTVVVVVELLPEPSVEPLEPPLDVSVEPLELLPEPSLEPLELLLLLESSEPPLPLVAITPPIVAKPNAPNTMPLPTEPMVSAFTAVEADVVVAVSAAPNEPLLLTPALLK